MISRLPTTILNARILRKQHGRVFGVMLVMRLPKRSTFSTTPRKALPSFVAFGLGAEKRTKSAISSPNLAGSTPLAR